MEVGVDIIKEEVVFNGNKDKLEVVRSQDLVIQDSLRSSKSQVEVCDKLRKRKISERIEPGKTGSGMKVEESGSNKLEEIENGKKLARKELKCLQLANKNIVSKNGSNGSNL